MIYKKVLVVSNMFPSKKYPSYGIFVKNFCDQLSGCNVSYLTSVLTKTTSLAEKVLKYFLFYIKTFILCIFRCVDLVYIHYPSYSAPPVLIARKIRKFDIFVNVHGTDVIPLKQEQEKMIHNTWKAIDESTAVVVPSEYYKKILSDKYETKGKHIIVYPSAGVNTDIFYEYNYEDKKAIRSEYGINENDFVIGYVSRINKAKGWDVFLDSLQELKVQNGRGLSIFIVGSGEDDELLEKRIEELPDKIKNQIKRFPLLDQATLAHIYNILDVFVFPTMSTSESLGLVAIEAMACCIPVIASDYAAPAFYIENGKNGFKFEKGNSEDLKNKIEIYASLTWGDIERMKKGAKDTANNYTTDNIASILREIFE